MNHEHKDNDNKKENEKEEFPGYPQYPASEDVYSQEGLIVDEIDPDDITRLKAPNEDPDAPNEKNFLNDMTGEDLDIPGNEADESNLGGGIEDEENNYYSLGGDDNNALEENIGD